jgi:hypothetical protein
MDETEKGETEGSFKQPKKVIVNMVEPIKKEKPVTEATPKEEPSIKVEPIKKKHHWSGFKTLAIALLIATTIFSLTAVIATVTKIKPAKGDQGETGATGPVGSTGATGATGAAGSNGTNGLDGKSVLTGESVPSNALGNDGDSYLNTTTFDYYLKVSGNWIKKGCLKGSNGSNGSNGTNGAAGHNGSNGTNGTNGASVLVGTATPDASVGVDGDSYVNTSTFDYYVKESGAWVVKGNIKGSNGSNGSNGTNGTNGSNGKSVLTGTTTPDNNDGVDGDSYVNTSTFDYYVKESGSWVVKGNIKGSNGSNGSNGTSAHWYLDIYDNPTTSSKTTGAITGDNYMDTKTGEVFTKGDSGWSSVGNLHALAVEVPVTISFNNGFDSLLAGHGIAEASGTPLADVITTAGSFITLPTASAFVVPASSIYSFVGFYTSDGVRWSDDMPVYKTTTLTAKWVDLEEYFSITDGELKLVKKYPYSSLIIPKTYGRQLVTSYIAPDDMTLEDAITSLSFIGDGLILGNGCFLGRNLQSVLLSGTNIKIGEAYVMNGYGPFQNCTHLSSFSFTGNSSCEIIRSFMAGDEDGPFKGCTNLSSVTITGLTTIGDYAFENCTSLENLSISCPNGDVTIGVGAFKDIKITKSGTFELSNISSFESSCFESSIITTNIPTNDFNLYLDDLSPLVEFQSDSFLNCTALESVYLQGNINTTLSGFSGCSALIRVAAYGTNSSSFNISNNAFGRNDAGVGCDALESLFFGAGLNQINDNAFSGCSPSVFTKITFGNSYPLFQNNAFQLEDTTGTASGYLNLIVTTNVKLSLPSYFYGKGIKQIIDRYGNLGLTIAAGSFTYSEEIIGLVRTRVLRTSQLNFSKTTLFQAASAMHRNEDDEDMTYHVYFGDGFYNHGVDYFTNYSDYCFDYFEGFDGAWSKAFTTGFDKVRYYGIDSSTFTYCESNAFQKSDVIITPATHLPSGWQKDMAGDYSGSNIIFGVTPKTTFHSTFTNYSTANTALYVTSDYDSGIRIMVGFSPDTVVSTEVDCTTNQGTSATKLMAHPFLDSVSPISVTLPTNISYIGSAFFEGIDLATTKVIYNGKKSTFDAIVKAEDWYDLGLGSSSYIHSMTNTGTPVAGQINCTVAE